MTYNSPINVCNSVIFRTPSELCSGPSDQLWNVSFPHAVSSASLTRQPQSLCRYRLWAFHMNGIRQYVSL